MSYMRAIKMGFMVIFVSLFLFGCGNSPETEAPAVAATQEPPISTEQVEPEGVSATSTAEPPTPTEEIATEEPAIDPLGTGDLAPDFTLPDSNGNMVNLADNLLDNRLVILVFYFSHT